MNQIERAAQAYVDLLLYPAAKKICPKLEIESMVGSWVIYLDNNCALYCTPFWEGDDGIALQISSPWGSEEWIDNAEFPISGNPEKDARAWMEIIAPSLKKAAALQAEAV